jgi:DNA-binding Lrp family transcriptional regulator
VLFTFIKTLKYFEAIFPFKENMVTIDLKDRKILYELDLDSRQSNTQIGKKVGLKKDVVSYRIKRMQDEGVIKNFWTAINTFKLGYNVFRIYINFHYVSTQIKNDIIQYFTDYKNSWAVVSVKGPIDIDVVVWVKNIYDFYKFWDKTLERYEDYFENYTISIYIEAIGYKKSYLLSESVKSNRVLYETICDGTSVNIDEMDYKLLNELAINARISLIDLAEKFGTSSQTINYRIKNLINKGIIQAFRVNIDRSKLGLQLFKVDVFLKEYKERKNIIKYLDDKGYLECLNVATGWSDIEPEIVAKDVDNLIQLMEEINHRFPNSIRKLEYWIMTEVHKERWLPVLDFK